jgi:hypothetical protein
MTDEKKVPDEELKEVDGGTRPADWQPGDGVEGKKEIVSPYAENPYKAPKKRPKPDWAE